MKNQLLALLLWLGGPLMSFSQIVIPSTEDYTVEVAIQLKSVEVAPNCEYNYVFNVNLDYKVSFFGEKQPSRLWTLYGYLKCGGIDRTYFPLTTLPGSGSSKTSNPVWRESICSVTDPQDLECKTVILVIQGPGISRELEYELPTSQPGSDPPDEILPVELLDFTASIQEVQGQVLLQWRTATEINNDFFIVEKSLDGLSWAALGSLPGHVTSASILSYEFRDPRPERGWVYYRLRQIDLDAREQYSPVVRVYVPYGEENFSLNVFPNPAHHQIQIEGQLSGIHTMMVYDAWGRLIRSLPVQTPARQLHQTLEVADLQPGWYFVQAGQYVVKFFKN